jgi:hypothetical protein
MGVCWIVEVIELRARGSPVEKENLVILRDDGKCIQFSWGRVGRIHESALHDVS